MSHWNYRVMLTKDKENLENYFGIKEVYYNDDNSIMAISENPISPFGETLEELTNDLEKFQKALKLPVLIESEIKFVDCSDDEEDVILIKGLTHE